MDFKTFISATSGFFLILILSTHSFGQNQEIQINNNQNLEMSELQEEESLECMECHREANIDSNEGVLSSQAFCLDCHKEKDCVTEKDGIELSLQLTRETFIKNLPIHQYVACTECHTDVARSPHRTETGAQCTDCHSVHGEAAAHAPHLRVECQACHFKSEHVKLDKSDHMIKLAHENNAGKPISLVEHELADTSDKESCQKCHSLDNSVGAPAAVLPSKGAICILCHAAPLKMGHWMFGAALLVFLGGLLLCFRSWFQGNVQGESESLSRKINLSSESVWSTVFSKQFFSIVKIFILDILLQRRILKESVSRWSMHSLIFLSILLRFALGLFTAAIFTANPDSDVAIALIDKNAPFTAFTNDLLGLLILLGIIWSVIKRFIVKPEYVVSEYKDNIALVIIGALIVLGFVLEGARILVASVPASIAGYAFVGYPLSKFFAIFGQQWWASFYSVLWYLHAGVGALFIAWLPFGKMRHIFTVPLTYFIEAVSKVKRGEADSPGRQQ